MKQYLVLLDRVIGDSKTLNKREFEKEYKGKDILQDFLLRIQRTELD